MMLSLCDSWVGLVAYKPPTTNMHYKPPTTNMIEICGQNQKGNYILVLDQLQRKIMAGEIFHCSLQNKFIIGRGNFF